MAQRLWPRAWELCGLLIVALVSWLEEAGFSGRRPPHLTLSRRTARYRHAAVVIAIGGPLASWAYAWHIRRIQREGGRRVV